MWVQVEGDRPRIQFPFAGIIDRAVAITFMILNEAFRSHGLRYQDAPDLCSLKLHREMANFVDDPLKTHYRIGGTELDDYRDSHLP